MLRARKSIMKSISRMRRYWMSIIFARRRLDRTPRGSRLAYEPISRSFSRPQRKRERRESKEGEWPQCPLRYRYVLEANPCCLPKHSFIANSNWQAEPQWQWTLLIGGVTQVEDTIWCRVLFSHRSWVSYDHLTSWTYAHLLWILFLPVYSSNSSTTLD